MKVSFFCVQPMSISINDYINLVDYDVKKENIVMGNLPSWMIELKKISNIAYENTINIKIESSKEIFLKKDIENKISEFIILEDKTAFLLFDYKLMTFNLCMELKMDLSYLSEEELDILIRKNGIENNFYYKVRKLIVKEDEESKLSNWTEDIIENSIIKIKEKINKISGYELKENVIVKPSTGNITVFIDLKDKDKIKKNKIEKFMKLNYEADRFDIENPEPLNLGKYDKYYFGGRFHTITYSDERNLISYYTIQYQVQQSWFYSGIITKLYNEINIKIIDIENKISYREKQKLINYFINKISTFELENEAFKMAIENNNEKIYKRIEKKWNIEETIKNIRDYINRFEKILEDQHKKLIEYENASKSIKEDDLKKQIELLNEERRQLEENGMKDHLTRAYNRQKFDLDMKERKKEEFYLAFIDGDKFKNINDKYGHQAGDEVLKKIVNTMFSVLKENEIKGLVYRFGGEEFLITMFEEKNISVLGILNMIKEEIEKAEIIYGENKIKFTISIGAVKSQENQSIEQIVEVADQLVYKAKENGRNRIEYIF